MYHQMVITFVGDDRVGLVEHLAQVIAHAGGSWLDSQLTTLAGKFAGVILVSIDDAAAETLSSALSELSSPSLRVTISPVTDQGSTTAALTKDPRRNLTLSVTGPDRPGIIREISAALAEVGISIHRLESGVTSAPWSGEPLFWATITVWLAQNVAKDVLEARLATIGDAMALDIDSVLSES